MNLNDRIESGKSESLENNPKNTNDNSESSKNSQNNQNTVQRNRNMTTILKSTIGSSQKKSMDESIPKEQEREELERKVIQEQKEKIQMLSSEISTLKSELQKKSEKIAKLDERLVKANEHIARQSNADLILKENERLQKEIDDTKAACRTRILGIENEYADKEEKAMAVYEKSEKMIKSAETAKAELIALTNNIHTQIHMEVADVANGIKKSMKNQYGNRIKILWLFIVIFVLYGVLSTVIFILVT